MLNLCHISSLKGKEICAFALIVCLITGLAPTAEGISVKLRGKIALGGILSGLAYTTYMLVTRDKRATEKLQLHLGPPDRVVQFERGFDRWRINHYGEQCYVFRNNRWVGKTALKVSCSCSIERLPWRTLGWKNGRMEEWGPQSSNLPTFQPSNQPSGLSLFLTDTPALVHPKWLRLCLLRPQRVPQFVFSYLYRLEAERLLGPQLWLSH